MNTIYMSCATNVADRTRSTMERSSTITGRLTLRNPPNRASSSRARPGRRGAGSTSHGIQVDVKVVESVLARLVNLCGLRVVRLLQSFLVYIQFSGTGTQHSKQQSYSLIKGRYTSTPTFLGAYTVPLWIRDDCSQPRGWRWCWHWSSYLVSGFFQRPLTPSRTN